MKCIELTDKDNTVVDVHRLEAISWKPRASGYIMQLYFYNRDGAMIIHYGTKTEAMVDSKRMKDKMLGDGNG